MKWLRGTLVVLIAAAMFSVAGGVARADDGGGSAVTAKCSLSFAGGVLGVSCTTSTGVTYTCSLQRTAVGTFGLSCSSSSSTTKLSCTFTLAPFTSTCKKE
ncbi:MAG TPA: hypothetical protein VH210_11930 [Gaiellaceae bacterium]|jgi:hypothetical protein|nr:hypothetical protein [Gaiellaceae bacterium]